MTQKSEQSMKTHQGGKQDAREGTPLILIVTKNGRVSDAAMKYSLNIAERLGYSLLVAYVNTLPFLWDGGRRDRFLEKAAKESDREFQQRALGQSIALSSVKEYGKVGKVIHRLCHIVKRIDMVVVDKGVNREEAASTSPVPIYCVQEKSHSPLQKLQYFPKKSPLPQCFRGRATQRKALHSAVFLGLCVVALYGVFYAYLDAIMRDCSKGGGYALLPVVATSVFFLVQNAFIGAVVAGIKARKAESVTGVLCSPSQGPRRRPFHHAQR